jgi:hypothetical protein
MTYNIKKSKIQLYKLRQEVTSDYWADITIDAYEKAGRIQIASDLGNWQYYWGSAGTSFKAFLTKLDIHYTAGKFGVGRFFDFQKTINLWKSEIIRNRKDETLSAKQSRTLFDEIKNVESEAPVTEIVFQQYVYNNAVEYLKFTDYMPETVTGISPQFQKFWDTAWQAFVAELKRELAEELQPA